MSLSAGKKLGPYEIQSPLGAGGMGEVYRARDTRLDRTVAVKILPEHLSENAEARQRFEREARAISSLSHPNICQLYDVGEADGLDYLVMEYLEGDTLATRLARGPLAMEQLVRCGIEIAEGLEQAHRSGVVHRDLKPGNIMLTKSGAKLMDFGLAKSAAPVASEPVSELTQALSSPRPAPTHPLTAQGTVVGTFQYMSPEQVEGREADARSDIFALGALLFEMATGKRAFEGRSATSAMAAVLEREPPAVSSLVPTAPPALDRIVKTCLEKEPDRRFQSAHDVGLQLRWLGEPAPTTASAPALTSAKRRLPLVPWIVAVLAAVPAVVFGVLFISGQKPGHVLRAQIVAPENLRFNLVGDDGGPLVLSPDGTHVVFSGVVDGKNRLYVRSLDKLTNTALTGTENATFPFWSPDSRSIGFFAGGKLKRIEIAGGPPLTICDAPVGRGGSWGTGGTILFAPNFSSPLFQVPANGGTPAAVTKLDAKYSTHRWPWFFPDGKHFLYMAASHAALSGPDTGVFVASLDGKENRLLIHTLSNAVYASGQLLYMRETALVAQPFDTSSRQTTGEPVVLTDDVQADATVWRASFTTSQNGILIYQPGVAGTGLDVRWVDRSGKPGPVAAPRDIYGQIQLSPDNKKLALSIGNPAALWVYDLERGTRTRLTYGADNYSDFVWSPDGKEIAYTVNSQTTGTARHFMIKAANGTGEEKELLKLDAADGLQALCDWSSDGRYLIYLKGTFSIGTGIDLWVLPLFGDRKPFPYDTAPADQVWAQFSNDGRWVAYMSNEAGRQEIYVAPFPWTGAKWQVSRNGGTLPRWRRDGRELYFIVPGSSQNMVAQVDGRGASFEVGEVGPLFTVANMSPTIAGAQWATTNDGQRFLIMTSGEIGAQPLTLVENWPAELKRH